MSAVEPPVVSGPQPARGMFNRPAIRAFLSAPSGIAALIGIGIIATVAIVMPIVFAARADRFDIGHTYSPVSWAHPLGTDSLGRDLFSRNLVAARLSLQLGLTAATIGICLGVTFGMIAALSKGSLRPILLRIIDAMLSFPAILTAIVVSTVIGLGAKGAVLGVGVALTFPIARLTSTLALSVGGREYINAARVAGVKSRRMMLRYVLPNIAEPLIIAFSITVSSSILAVSALSFLGLGVQAPQYDWGRLLTEGVKAIYLAPASALGPAAAIALTALAFAFAGEALARALNPLLWTAPRKSRGARGNATPASAPVLAAPMPFTEDALPLLGESTEEPQRDGLALEVRDMVVSFPSSSGTIEIVKGISFTVRPSQVVGIVGESGSGKTMTALAVAQLTPFPGKVTGTIKLHGRELKTMRARELSRFLAHELAFVFQDPSSSLNPALKIGSQMTFATRIHQKLSRNAARTLAASRLNEVHIGAAERQLDRYPHELSGGMRQRVMIAMGLMAEPSVLIADEPTTALDVTVQAQIMDLMAEINSSHRNTAIVFISHNLALVSQNCDRVLVMYAGRIVEDLDVDQLRADPKHPYTTALLAAVPEIGMPRDQPLAFIPGEAPDIANPPSGCPFHPRCPLVRDVCKVELPPLLTRPSEQGRRVACHVANEEIG